MHDAGVTVKDVTYSTESHRYRTPIKFGGCTLDRVTLLNVLIVVESNSGRRAIGSGSMPLGNVWAFPSATLTYEQTLDAMQAIAARVARIYAESGLAGHPIDVTMELEPSFFTAAEAETERRKLIEPIPRLATLVAASPFDAALHDAFGKIHGVSVYQTYDARFWNCDLERFLGQAFRGVSVEQHLTREPVESLPLYHLVGALDPLTAGDVAHPIGDGRPETLQEWIAWSGLTHLKIKLNGDDVAWDVDRVCSVQSATSEVQSQREVHDWRYSLDFNEKCRSVDYLLQFLARVRERSPEAFRRIEYIEQPTARDLAADRQNTMHATSRQIPVVIDESLLDVDSLLLAREMGYTGAALKACKGQSQSILLACAARHLGMFLCVQDLTCPGASLIHSAGLAAHVRGVAAIEANSRQYCPAANAGWVDRFPEIFDPRDGRVRTGRLTGPGL